MIVLLWGALAGAIIEAIFDDGDSKASKKNESQEPVSFADQFTAYIELKKHVYTGELSTDEALTASKKIALENRGNLTEIIRESDRVGRMMNDPSISQAQRQEIQSKYLGFTGVDDTVEQKTTTIYNPIDPSDDSDMETDDAFSFETEIENLFGPEQMAISEEDIAPESDIQDWDITEPTDEISQDREIIIGDDTVSPEDEISVIEETTPFEEVFYPDKYDFDLDPTDDTDDLFAPDDLYQSEDVIVDQIEWMEQELDNYANEIEANTFQSAAWTFSQDTSQESLTTDESYQDIGQELNIIDFENFLDDTAAIPLDLASDHLGVPFFQWVNEPPGGETLDTSPF